MTGADWFKRLNGRSHSVARTVLQRDNGIDARRLAVASLDAVFQIDPDTLTRRFLTHAPALATAAAARALQTSSAFVYFVLQAALADDVAGGWWWLSAFGAGLSCHGALLRVQ